jgi:mycarose O-acyltransferase
MDDPAPDTRLHALDGLRALAVGLVFLHHGATSAIAQSLLDHGHAAAGRALGSLTAAGVELFFCLSGVVLLRRYLRTPGPFDARTYFRRRFTRLYPPFAAAWLFAGAAIWVVGENPTWWTAISRLPRFDPADFAAESALGIGGGGAYNWAWWSLAPEMVFYATVPLIVGALRRRRDPDAAVRWLLLSGGLLSMVFFYFAPTASHGQVATMFAQYFVCFCVGILLARRPLTATERRLSLAAGVALLALAFASPRANVHVGYAFLFMPLIDACMRGTPAASRLFGGAGMVWLGERSYSLFLTHYSVINISCLAASAMFPKGAAYFAVSRGLSVVGSLVVACLLFGLVERWFARGLVTADRLFPWSAPRPRRARPAELEARPSQL